MHPSAPSHASSSPRGRNKARQVSSGAGTQELEDRGSGNKNTSANNLKPTVADEIRRSSYGPEFLKQFAGSGLPGEYTKDGGGKFKVIAGPEATTFYQNFLG